MTTIESATLYMAIVGFLSGLYALWLSDRNERQRVTIGSSEKRPNWYKITNHSLRSIPIQKIVLLVRNDRGFMPSNEIPQVEGIDLPGVLPPESAFEVTWASIRQVAEMILSGETILEVHTQTGNIIRSKKTKIKKHRTQCTPVHDP
jgi:hypothetical protein